MARLHAHLAFFLVADRLARRRGDATVPVSVPATVNAVGASPRALSSAVAFSALALSRVPRRVRPLRASMAG
jgi:hypothetical protein